MRLKICTTFLPNLTAHFGCHSRSCAESIFSLVSLNNVVIQSIQSSKNGQWTWHLLKIVQTKYLFTIRSIFVIRIILNFQFQSGPSRSISNRIQIDFHWLFLGFCQLCQFSPISTMVNLVDLCKFLSKSIRGIVNLVNYVDFVIWKQSINYVYSCQFLSIMLISVQLGTLLIQAILVDSCLFQLMSTSNYFHFRFGIKRSQ